MPVPLVLAGGLAMLSLLGRPNMLALAAYHQEHIILPAEYLVLPSTVPPPTIGPAVLLLTMRESTVHRSTDHHLLLKADDSEARHAQLGVTVQTNTTVNVTGIQPTHVPVEGIVEVTVSVTAKSAGRAAASAGGAVYCRLVVYTGPKSCRPADPGSQLRRFGQPISRH